MLKSTRGLKLVLQLTQQGLTSESERCVTVAVGLFAKIAQGLASSRHSWNESFEVFSTIKATLKPSFPSLLVVLELFCPVWWIDSKKLNELDDREINWWSEVFAAPGPPLAPYAPSLLTHSLKLLGPESTESESILSALLASMSTYDPEIIYGDSDEDADDEDLDDLVENGLFSFGQL